MSLLTEREWCTSYRHEDGDLIELFYNPALTCSDVYPSFDHPFLPPSCPRVSPSRFSCEQR
jgi:hypothetical protein